MADTLYGVAKVHGFTTTGVETIGSRQEYIVIQTNVDIRAATQAGGSDSSQANLDKLISIVSLRGQPIILGAVGSGGSSTYSIVFFNEHYNAWGCVQGVSGDQLIDRIVADGVNYGFPADNGGGHLVVSFCDTLDDVVQFFS